MSIPTTHDKRRRNVEHLHKECGLTLQQIAERYGVSRTTVANWRNGRSRSEIGPECPDCGNPMMRKALRCGLCIEEAKLTAVAA